MTYDEIRKQRDRVRAKAVYDRRKNAGLCTRCGVNPPDPGRRNCDGCLGVGRVGGSRAVGPYKQYPEGSFLAKLCAMSGLTVTQISNATGMYNNAIYRWRTSNPSNDQLRILKEKLFAQ